MKSTQNQQTGAWIESSDRCTFYGVMSEPLQLDYTPPGDRCIYCNADAYTCEHFADAEREARLDAQAEYEDQIRYEREAYSND